MKLKIYIFILLTSLLTSCVALLVAGGAAAGGLIVYDRRSVPVMEADTRIFYQINRTIANDPLFRNSRIAVSSFNQTVLLVGQTPTASLRVLAEKIAKRGGGVRGVYNQISIQSPIPFAQRSTDTWITSQVRGLMLARKGLQSGSMRVVTENGVVYLMGIVSRQQANLAVNEARQVQGVRKVVKVFRYIN
ncbi:MULTISPECIES: BON domain-containing protein [Legionella]|uniref:BON domain-containing protein n=1 Tax=Legionella septentrionalis TaxID=2498109 RepID=A0A433JJZ0_9GAMM|nr:MULTISPECIES: BON domain-containing protein [Legionella]MCP0914875.1 BON domain-containing protein [Legionella sp. 27cVA30]RUQ88825.1 BON domain-containing protein [Legionella septentrionalis]RUR02938.1 BON domain-containing protein [Legionella septentrionalis]RUR11537.1 BON domain-containing protein [Legionella septentrionalis]RUR16802.1 BON domain-containing protein [Legionella septentrionalis]